MGAAIFTAVSMANDSKSEDGSATEDFTYSMMILVNIGGYFNLNTFFLGDS